jgi:hypothetical protein
MEDDQLYKNGEIDWDFVVGLYKDNKKQINVPEKDSASQEEKILECKKCKVKFTCKNYNGKYPLCIKHRLRE